MIFNTVPGKILDIDYRLTAAKYGVSAENRKAQDLDNFPIEEARIRSLTYSLLVCGLLIVGYGWLLQRQVVRKVVSASNVK